MAGTIFTSTIANQLKATLDTIHMDSTDGLESKLLYKKYCEMKRQKDNYDDELSVAGPPLVSEKSEGAEMDTGDLVEGWITRFRARTWALTMRITEETMEDSKYPMVIELSKHLKRAMLKTQEVDAANMLVRGFNSAYVGSDEVPMFSNAHRLERGGTFSNVMAVPMAPSAELSFPVESASASPAIAITCAPVSFCIIA